MDSGANMFVANKKKYFHQLVQKKIAVDLAIGEQGSFAGVGVVLATAPEAPNFLFMLYPTFYAPRDSCCTVSNGSFQKYMGFSSVIIDTWRNASFQHKSGSQFTLPFTTINSIDYITLNIHMHTNSSRRLQQDLTCRAMSLQPASIHHKLLRGTPVLTVFLHIMYGHRSVATLQQMIDDGYIKGTGFPCKLAPLPGRCPICDAAGLTKLRRGPPVDTTQLPVGSRFHIDFTFFNKTSLRGFTSVLVIVEATERYLWFFPCRHKSAPLDLCLFFFSSLRRQGLPVINLRSDEDGALVGNTEFCSMMYKSLGIAMQSTGGYSSTINGAAETPHRTLKKSIRAMLMGSNLADTFWCFAGQYAAQVYNSCTNRTTGRPPALRYSKKLLPASKVYPFGSRVRVIKDLPTKRALSARAAGDPRAYDGDSIFPSEIERNSSFDGIFLGYSSSDAVALVYKRGDSSDRIHRAHQLIVDPHGLSTSPADTLLPHEHMLRTVHNAVFTGQDQVAATSNLLDLNFDIASSDLELVDSLFNPDDCETFEITLPPKGIPIGMTFTTDEDFLLPILVRIDPAAGVYPMIPIRHHFCKSWVIHIQNERPITSNGAKEILQNLQQENPRVVSITFSPMTDPVRYNYQSYRAIFDSCTGFQHAHMAVMANKPEVFKTF